MMTQTEKSYELCNQLQAIFLLIEIHYFWSEYLKIGIVLHLTTALQVVSVVET